VSAKTVSEKLLIRPSASVWLSDPSRIDLIRPLPIDSRLVDGPQESSTALVFADYANMLRDILESHKGQLAQPEKFWVAYPSANRADINRDTLWPILGEYGMRPISQVAINEVWSALRFRPLKEGEAPFTDAR
jgi:hypothetical protein